MFLKECHNPHGEENFLLIAKLVDKISNGFLLCDVRDPKCATSWSGPLRIQRSVETPENFIELYALASMLMSPMINVLLQREKGLLYGNELKAAKKAIHGCSRQTLIASLSSATTSGKFEIIGKALELSILDDDIVVNVR